MRIKRIQLRNGYKRFHDLTIDLGENPARIVALVGPNGCGKSSVLDGILFRIKAHQSIGTHINRDPSYHSRSGQAFNYSNIRIDLLQEEFESVVNRRSFDGSLSTLVSFRSPYRYNNQVKIDSIRATDPIKNNHYGAGDASSLDSKMEENYRRLQATVNSYMQTQDVKPSEARAAIIGELNESISSCLDLKISSVGNVEAGQGTLYFKKDDAESEFDFNVLSSGEKEVIDLITDLYLRKKDYKETIFLFDEPELHINTSIQGRLLREIDRLVGDQCQIWMTTHSIGFLRELQTNLKDKCQIVQFKSEYDLGSKSFSLKPVQASAMSWRDLFSVALDDLAALVCPQTIIYCEGRDKPGSGGAERGMDAQVYNLIFNRSRPDSLFISSGGNTELDQRSAIAISILGKVFPTVEIWVLKDRDMASGKTTTENDRLIYLQNNDSNHRLLKRYEIENYLFDKEVLRNYCNEIGTNFAEDDYDALVVDIINQNVKDQTGRIKNICGIVGSISADKFKLELARHLTPDLEVYIDLESCIFDRA